MNAEAKAYINSGHWEPKAGINPKGSYYEHTRQKPGFIQGSLRAPWPRTPSTLPYVHFS